MTSALLQSAQSLDKPDRQLYKLFLYKFMVKASYSVYLFPKRETFIKTYISRVLDFITKVSNVFIFINYNVSILVEYFQDVKKTKSFLPSNHFTFLHHCIHNFPTNDVTMHRSIGFVAKVTSFHSFCRNKDNLERSIILLMKKPWIVGRSFNRWVLRQTNYPPLRCAVG